MTHSLRALPRTGDFSWMSRLRSFRHATRGLASMLHSQHNAWIHTAATLATVATGFALGIDRLEWLAITLVIAAVWTAEALNTAFEALCDVASPEFHPAVARAKDIAAGAVLISAVCAVIVAGIVFIPHLPGFTG